MTIGLLWGFLLLFLILAAGITAAEMRRPRSGEQTILVFLENSEEIAEGVLRNICRKARRCRDEIRILVIDHGSTDSTVPIVERLAGFFPEINIVPRSGQGSLKFYQPWNLENICGVLDLRDAS
ncbi:MAG: glycosyltransferase [Bacillota bacterium]